MGSPKEPIKLLVIGPLPPPAYGVATATRLMVESSVLTSRFRLLHLDTSDHRSMASMGRLDWRNLYLGLKHLARLVCLLLRERPEVTLLTASQGRLALVRDALFTLAARATRSRLVVYFRGSRYAEIRVRQGRVAARMLRFIAGASSSILVLGQSLADMAHAVAPKARVAVVPNGCPPAVETEQVGTRDESHPVLLYMGALSPAKGVYDALGVARELAASLEKFEFVFSGQWSSPECQTEAQRLIDRDGLAPVVRFPGPQHGDEKRELLARAWALVVTSHSEGQPWAVLEAMSAGVPVVATATGAIPDTVEHGVTGHVAPVGDIEALSAHVLAILRDRPLWERLSQASEARYNERFTVEQSHAALAEEIERVARGR